MRRFHLKILIKFIDIDTIFIMPEEKGLVFMQPHIKAFTGDYLYQKLDDKRFEFGVKYKMEFRFKFKDIKEIIEKKGGNINEI